MTSGLQAGTAAGRDWVEDVGGVQCSGAGGARVGERLGQVTVVLQEGGCGRAVPGWAKPRGYAKLLWTGPIFGLTDGHRAGLQLGLVPWGFISFVQLLWVGSWSLAGAAGWNRQ